MHLKRSDIFATIRTEGAILPSDLLGRLADVGGRLDGRTPESYHLFGGETLNEAINRAWNRALGLWSGFVAARARLSETEPGTSVTRERWLLPLLQELGYGRLIGARAVEMEGKSYPVSHVWGHLPIHLVGFRVDLDRRSQGVAGASRSSPHSMMQEFLNRSEANLWGFVSNGLRFRILRDNASLARQAYVEFDLEAMMEGEAYSDFVLFWLLCHQSRVEAERPSECWLERWSREAAERGARALDGLRAGVEEAIVSIGRGLLSYHGNRELRERLRRGELSRDEFYRRILRLVYGLIFLFVAEDRDLLLLPDAPEAARERYRRYYSTARLRALAGRRMGSDHTDLYAMLRVVVGLLGDGRGGESLGLPALGSVLFTNGALAGVIDAELTNRALLDAVRALAFVVDHGVMRPVDYRNLGSEELGSVYESLLELHPEIELEIGTFALVSAAGNERKSTGSYYTPTGLIVELLDSALDPVLDEAARSRDPEAAILALKVCDPACGSGHFLIAAAHRIARRLASVRTGDEEPSPDETRKALREVIGKVVYGVDLNPMAVELCKVALWMEAIEPGRPLSFLDHHIRVGNSLIGATPALLNRGIPDEAFAPIEGDDKAVCAEYRKQNRIERKGGMQRLFGHGGEPWERLGRLREAMDGLDAMRDDTIDDVHRKEETFERHIHSESYRFSRLLADAWCAAFVWRRTREAEGDGLYPITEDEFRRLEHNPFDLTPVRLEEIRRLAERYRFFHWGLEFSDVFRSRPYDEIDEESTTGWNGGFDVVLGNPPWERVKLQEKEWFASRSPEITAAPNAAARKRMIDALKQTNLLLYDEFLDARRVAEGESHLLRDSGRYPLCGRGDVNTYTIFSELNRSLAAPVGRVGIIVPSGIATDDTTKYFFQDLMDTRSLASLYDFENREGIFPGVHRSYKFCLLTMTGSDRPVKGGAEFVFFALAPADLREEERRFRLSAEDIALLNPNTRTCPIFRSKRDAEITKAIYRRVPVLIREREAEENPWGIRFGTMFHMSNDSHLFRTREQLESESWALEGNVFVRGGERYLPLYEGRLGHQFNHRFAVEPGGELREVTPEESIDPKFVIESHYYVPEHDVRNWFEGRNYSCSSALLGHRRVSRNTDERTSIACLFPFGAASYGWIISLGPSAEDLMILCAGYNSFAFDYLLRNSLSQPSIPIGTFKQIPLPLPSAIDEGVAGLMHRNVLELTYTAWDLAPFARDCGYDGPPFRWDEERRFLLRCELDAAFFHLYGIGRGDVEYIMGTFPIVRRKDEAAHGEYRTMRVVLEIYDAMAEAARDGGEYRTRLDPPPADRSVAHGAAVEGPSSRRSVPVGSPAAKPLPVVVEPEPPAPVPDPTEAGAPAEPETTSEGASLRSIGAIGEEELLATVRALFAERGPLEADEAISSVARALGFRRVGKKIREAARHALDTAARRGIVFRDGGTYRIDCRAVTDYPDELLDTYLFAAMGRAWQSRDEAVRSTAGYLGFRRVGSVIRETIDRALERGIGSGEIEADGERVRRRR